MPVQPALVLPCVAARWIYLPDRPQRLSVASVWSRKFLLMTGLVYAPARLTVAAGAGSGITASVAGERIPPLNGFKRAERGRAFDVHALVIALFDVIGQIPTGAGMRTRFAKRAVKHAYTSALAEKIIIRSTKKADIILEIKNSSLHILISILSAS